jgi:hypothetical protein
MKQALRAKSTKEAELLLPQEQSFSIPTTELFPVHCPPSSLCTTIATIILIYEYNLLSTATPPGQFCTHDGEDDPCTEPSISPA